MLILISWNSWIFFNASSVRMYSCFTSITKTGLQFDFSQAYLIKNVGFLQKSSRIYTLKNWKLLWPKIIVYSKIFAHQNQIAQQILHTFCLDAWSSYLGLLNRWPLCHDGFTDCFSTGFAIPFFNVRLNIRFFCIFQKTSQCWPL